MRFKFIPAEEIPTEDKHLQELALEAERIYMDARSMQDIIRGWIGEGREIEMCPGQDEDGKLSVLLILWTEETKIAQFEVGFEDVKAAFPNAISFSDSIHEWNAPNISPDVEDASLDYWLSNRTQKLGGKFDDDLLQDVFDLTGAVEVAVSYALSLIGSVYISLLDTEALEDIKERIGEMRNMISLSLQYNHSVTRNGWGEFCSAYLR